MLKQVRQSIINHLWEIYRDHTPQMQIIETGLRQKGIQKLILDHFAIIDLPGPHTGIPYLKQIFSAIGYIIQGKDYLPDKQNDFLWMTESDSLNYSAEEVLPQVVVADFRLDELPDEIKKIIEKYGQLAKPSPLASVQQLANRVNANDEIAAKELHHLIVSYLAGRDWPLPTTKEFHTVQEFNELLAWVLVFGRLPNHFTLSIHLLNHFQDLNDFHRFIEDEMHLSLNQDGGTIKGGKNVGIAQGSTAGISQTVALSDGVIALPTGFVEFVWRYPHHFNQPIQSLPWGDYFTGFVAQHADRVIESLFDK